MASALMVHWEKAFPKLFFCNTDNFPTTLVLQQVEKAVEAFASISVDYLFHFHRLYRATECSLHLCRSLSSSTCGNLVGDGRFLWRIGYQKARVISKEILGKQLALEKWGRKFIFMRNSTLSMKFLVPM
ncbi:hypothetical protein NE237_019299 [Protea cynaroides]|uniref:Uncharacterized protein n=1 Tax=Protea cynaroides TaxID=273540 RepID=A0A9Q0QPR0_9MAGN|nr:hypothetical protein NE237_019299 [Protea cynaroides]